MFLVTMAILVFNWAVKSGQFDDLEGPAHSILFDDDIDMIPDEAKTNTINKISPDTEKNTPSNG
jgi:cbb3-type cytochrome oxidase maturation protein